MCRICPASQGKSVATEMAISVVRIGWTSRSGTTRGGTRASTLSTAAEKMAAIMAHPNKCRYLGCSGWESLRGVYCGALGTHCEGFTPTARRA
jgi:hypothetical protein